MTLPPERIGDKGQRFVVEVKDYPNKGWQECAYHTDLGRAEETGRTLSKAPTATDFRIWDRQNNERTRPYVHIPSSIDDY